MARKDLWIVQFSAAELDKDLRKRMDPVPRSAVFRNGSCWPGQHPLAAGMKNAPTVTIIRLIYEFDPVDKELNLMGPREYAVIGCGDPREVPEGAKFLFSAFEPPQFELPVAVFELPQQPLIEVTS